MARKIQGIRIARTAQAAKLAEKAQEVVAAELKLHEMSETAKDLADQLSKVKAELEDSRKAQHETEEALKKNILDHAKLGRHVDMILTEVGVPPVQMPPQVLGDRLNLLSGFVKERELSTSRQVMHRVLSLFSSLYQGLDLQALSGGWAPGYSNEELDKIEEDCAALAQAIADTVMKDLELIPKDTPEDGSGLLIRCIKLYNSLNKTCMRAVLNSFHFVLKPSPPEAFPEYPRMTVERSGGT